MHTKTTHKTMKRKSQPITVPMILQAQKDHKEREIAKKVYWHHDYAAKFEDDILWGKKINDYNVRIYSSYIVARRVVYTGIRMCKFEGALPTITDDLMVKTQCVVEDFIEQGYKVCGIALEDLTSDPKKRFNKIFLEFIARDIWNMLVTQAKQLKK